MAYKRLLPLLTALTILSTGCASQAVYRPGGSDVAQSRALNLPHGSVEVTRKYGMDLNGDGNISGPEEEGFVAEENVKIGPTPPLITVYPRRSGHRRTRYY